MCPSPSVAGRLTNDSGGVHCSFARDRERDSERERDAKQKALHCKI